MHIVQLPKVYISVKLPISSFFVIFVFSYWTLDPNELLKYQFSPMGLNILYNELTIIETIKICIIGANPPKIENSADKMGRQLVEKK